jgi:hypothetical protein
MTNLVKIDIEGRIRRYIRMKFLKACKDTLELDTSMVGYVIVSWDIKGTCTTTFETRHSPLAVRFLPGFIKDAVERRIAVEDAVYESTGIDMSSPDDSA